MNRAERRRQKKLAGKAGRSPNQPTLANQQALGLALQHHNAGRLSDAKHLYQQILQTDPNQPDALHLLGVVSSQMGEKDIAVDLIKKALANRPDFSEAHHNLGNVFFSLGRFDEAVASCQKALAINPNYAEAHNNLGNAFRALGKFDEAIASYHKAITIKPDYAEAHGNLGASLEDLGKHDEAFTSLWKALAINPNVAETHYHLGNAFRALGKFDEAIASYRKALTIKPDFAEAHGNLGASFEDLGKYYDAFTSFRKATALKPLENLFWAGLAVTLERLSFTSVDDGLVQDLTKLLDCPSVSASKISKPVINALRCHPDFSQIFEQINKDNPDASTAWRDAAERLSAIPLFLRIMKLSPMKDPKVEQMLTFLRRAMVHEAAQGKVNANDLPLLAALALQCFTNEYIYPETDEEKEDVESLCQQIETLVEKNQDVPPSFLAALGAYRPLHQFPWAQELGQRAWAGDFKEVIERQISEPQKEQFLRSQIPCLTPIQDIVSQSVREQYEENPYPRWIKTGIPSKSRSIGSVLGEAPLHFDLGDYDSPESPEILVAGCGTGQHALSVASRFTDARVLAVDLSLSSLSYAIRKTRELGISNIEYAQGDIMELGSIEQRFDLIESCGVLHHLGDPLAGWRVLVGLLRPGGLMKIALYSEAARRDVVEARSLIADKGYATSPQDVRQCRQDIIAMAEDGNSEMASISTTGDFYSLSNCRDLLFHVQEQRFTLPQIEAALTSLNLRFIGFEMKDKEALRKFTAAHPDNDALTALALWDKFEHHNPDTFRGMYQFWCKKL